MYSAWLRPLLSREGGRRGGGERRRLEGRIKSLENVDGT